MVVFSWLGDIGLKIVRGRIAGTNNNVEVCIQYVITLSHDNGGSADQRARRIRQHAQHQHRMPSAAALALAEWNVVITNAPRTLISPTEVWVVMRVRWQIELLFKLWKSHARIDDWRTANPARVLCEIYAKLIGLVFQQWLLAASSWHDPERSLFKAATIVAGMAGELASTQADPPQFLRVLTRLAALIQRWATTNKRQQPPTTAQRLRALTAV